MRAGNWLQDCGVVQMVCRSVSLSAIGDSFLGSPHWQLSYFCSLIKNLEALMPKVSLTATFGRGNVDLSNILPFKITLYQILIHGISCILKYNLVVSMFEQKCRSICIVM
jgi:hypothetical protein